MERFVLAIDQGTTGSRALIVNASGHIVADAYSEFPQLYPQPGWVEHDPEAIWQTTLGVVRRALAAAQLTPDRLAAIGITNQRETTVVWDRRTLAPVHNAIVWQCRRSAAICDRLKADGHEPVFRRRTGLLLDAYFSGTKLTWLFEHDPGLKARAAAGELAFGTIDSWLVARLTGGRRHVTDPTNAARTLMFDIHARAWAPELLDLLGVPAAMLPEVAPSSGVLGTTAPEVLGAEVPIAGIAGDQQAALFGQACFDAGQAKNTYGTGCFLLLNVGARRVDPGPGLLLTLACDRAGQGVYLVPAFAGLGAPHWDMYARGGILGITRGTRRAHIVRAALESIAYQTRDLTGAIEAATGIPFTELRVDGGACRNDFLMQFQADLLGCPVNRSRYLESTGMGAAFLAGLAVGVWDSPEAVAALRTSERAFVPVMDAGERARLCAGWQAAVQRVKSGETNCA
jgi:glycerol kinase